MKIVAILPAYNAEATLVPFLAKLPKKFFSAIILSDDCSRDDTYGIARKQKGIIVYKTPHNLGYGGNVKFCLQKAIAAGADVMIELHPDGEYGTDGIVPAIAAVKSGAGLVLGNRFDGRPVKNGMSVAKYIGSRLLTFIENIFLGTHVPDMHQGFRVYTKTLLAHTPWRAMSNDYLFSFEIICAAIRAKIPIASVPVSVHYRGEKRGAHWGPSIRYTLQTLRKTIEFLQR